MSKIHDHRPIQSNTNILITIILAISNLILAIHFSKFAPLSVRCDMTHPAPEYLFWNTFIAFIILFQQVYLVYFGGYLVNKAMNSPFRKSTYFSNMSDNQMRIFSRSMVVAVSYIIMVISLISLIEGIDANRCTF